MRRALRDYGNVGSLADAEMRITHVARRALAAVNIDILRGYEGEGAALYFSAFGAMIRHEDRKFTFQGRSAGHRLIGPMLCYLSSMPFWAMIVEVRWRVLVSIRLSAFSM